MTEMKNWMPQLDPACFPLLHPRATPGWRWFMKKRAEKVKILYNYQAKYYIQPRGKGTTQIEFEIEGEQEIEHDGEEFGQNFNHDLDRDGPEDELDQNEDTENGELEEDEEPMDVDLYGRDVIPLTFVNVFFQFLIKYSNDSAKTKEDQQERTYFRATILSFSICNQA